MSDFIFILIKPAFVHLFRVSAKLLIIGILVYIQQIGALQMHLVYFCIIFKTIFW